MRKAISLFLLWIFSTFCFMAQHGDMQHILRRIGEKHVPDSRKEVFEVSVSKRSDTLVLSGETTNRAAYREIVSEAEKAQVPVENGIRLLPDEVVGEKCWGVIYNSVAKMHSGSSHGSETVSEVLLGMPVRLLDKKGGWRRVQAPDGYIGWVSEAVETMTGAELREYNNTEKVVVTALYARSCEKADAGSQTVSDLVAGDMLVLKGVEGPFYRVMYPDGREAYVLQSDAKELDKWLKNIEFTQQGIVKTAMRFKGIPYVWGGASPKGLDCSGLVKMVCFLHGVILQRDASQQVLTGRPVGDTGDFSKLQPGDLLFFGTQAKVVHVAIYVGERRFIHASDYVRIGSLDPADPLYDGYNAGRYLCARRVIGEVNTAGIEAITDNAFYKR